MSTPSILQEAEELINGPRQSDYGHPADDFATTADLFNDLMKRKYGPHFHEIGNIDVALFMVCLKLSREAHRHKRDNLVDACGYLGTIEKIYRRAGIG